MPVTPVPISYDLATLWAAIIAVAIFAYVVLDGFDLGIGILFPALSDEGERGVAMNTVAPVWDGNETWLILGGGGLFAAFPLAYAVLMPALYPLVIAMLLGLVFRGVAFEFRWRAGRMATRHRWDLAFFGGSLVAALAQGIMLGAILQGVQVEGRAYAGGWWDWLTPFSLLTGVALVVGYALLGATWLLMKTDGAVNAHARRLARPALLATVAAIGLVSLWTPFLKEQYFDRWLNWPNILWVAPVPILLAAAAWQAWRKLNAGDDRWAFPMALGIFFLSFSGLGISIYPQIVPGALTIYEAATVAKSQVFMLVGVALLLPVILAYTAWTYWVFRGKVRAGEGYH